MLIQKIRDGYRSRTSRLLPAKPVMTIAARWPASNASYYGSVSMKARRLRRQRRAERIAHRNATGWVVRTW